MPLRNAKVVSFYVVTLIAFTPIAWAFKESKTLTHISAQEHLKAARARNIVLEGAKTKEEIRALSARDFFSQLNDSLSHDAGYQSYLYEIRDGKNAEQGKLIAANILYTAALDKWDSLEKSAFNDLAVQKKDRIPFILSKIKNLYYIPSDKHAPGEKRYFYSAQNWGSVLLTYNEKQKTWSSAKWTIDVNSQWDQNKLAPEAQNLEVIDDSAQTTRSSPDLKPKPRPSPESDATTF